MAGKQEDFINRALALLLREQGLATDFEQRAGRRRMDVVAEVDGLRIVLEAETGFHRRAQAVKDADARLRQGLTVAVFAVCYPEGVTEENLAEATLTWTLRLKEGEPPGEWASGSAAQLAQAVQQAPRSLSGADRAARRLSDCLDEVAQSLKTPVRRELARALDLPATKPDGRERSEGRTPVRRELARALDLSATKPDGRERSDGRTPVRRELARALDLSATKPDGRERSDGYFVAAKRGMLVVATAMLFHHRVQEHLPAALPDGYDGDWPPASPVACVEMEAVISAFREAWRGILAVDYRPVFETGRAALAALTIDPDAGQAVRKLAGAVSEIAEDVAGLRHDLLGRIFHRVLDTARYDGSFYTSTAAAVLLASLAIREGDADWSDANAVAALRICDPACGTGTLLMAAAERIRDLRNAAGRSDPADEEALGLLLVEDVLWGYDVNLTATHMAASTLGMLSPTTKFNRMNIHRALLGVFDGEPYLGSLDFLAGQARLAAWPSTAQQVDSESNSEPPPPMSLVIMNPPFTRDSLRHDQFSRADEQAVKRREKEIMEDQPHRAAARLHSSGGAFTVLAEKMLKDDGGTLALVLPSVVPTAPGNLELRKYLAQRFHIDTIVSSHDPNRIFFSENTSIGEVLLICRRWDGDGPKPPTRVVNLARNPATAVEALDTAARIERSGEGGNHAPRDFTAQWVDAGRIARGDWFAVNFLSPFLVEAYRTLSEGNPATVPTVPLGQLAAVGPAGQRIRDAYVHSDMPTLSGRRALWYHKTDVTQCMAAETDVYIEPKSSKRLMADSYWEQRSQLLLPHRLRLNVARVAAVMLPERAVGSIWTPCRPHNPDIAKALCLYLNSTPGLLSLLGERDNRVPSYPSFSLDTLRSLPVPDFAALGEAERGLLDGWFDRLQGERLQPFPRLPEDAARQRIDDAVCEALGLDGEWVATIRRELAREPSVTDRGGGAGEG